MSYIFNPKDFGFHPVTEFPHMFKMEEYLGGFDDKMVKIVDFITFGNKGLMAFEFLIVKKVSSNINTWEIKRGTYNEAHLNLYCYPIFVGAIFTKEFAKLLMVNILGKGKSSYYGEIKAREKLGPFNYIKIR